MKGINTPSLRFQYLPKSGYWGRVVSQDRVGKLAKAARCRWDLWAGRLFEQVRYASYVQSC